jgi:hypothetical protein
LEPVQWSLRWPTESSFGNIFAKWSDLTISDQTRSRLQSARDYIEADTPPTATASEGNTIVPPLISAHGSRGGQGAALVR